MPQSNAAQVLPFAKEPEKPKPSFADALAQTKKADTGKKKSSIPPLAATPEVKDAVDTYQENKITVAQATAAMDAARVILEDYVRVHQDKEGYAGRYSNSYSLAGNRHTAKVIYANKFTLAAEDGEQLEALLGDNFEDMITRKFFVSLKAEVLQNETLQAELMELIGDRFGDFFETKASLAVTEGFDRAIYRAVKPDQLEALRTFAKQYKPSIR